MQQIDMSNGKPMAGAADAPWVRYSATYPTGAERSAKEMSLTMGDSPLYFGFDNVFEKGV